MKFTVTEEFVREAHDAACSTWKQRIEKEFPEAFPSLEIGRWHKSKYGELEWLMNYQGYGCVSYGFHPTKEWTNTYEIHNLDNWTLATTEEVESALIAEAKKKGFIDGAYYQHAGVGIKRKVNGSEMYYNVRDNTLRINGFAIFQDGKWAEILPEEKTIITKGKALRIIAKKLKVSPESIEIQ